MSVLPSPETVSLLKDRLKHGQNVVQILQSQVDTAQQNIVLLQGQVRLAKETISSLKRHFEETENLFHMGNNMLALSKVVPYDYSSNILREGEKLVKCSGSSTASPTSRCGGVVRMKREDGRSPYAQQLRQVLDALQDEEPHRSGGGAEELHQNHASTEEAPHSNGVVLGEGKNESSERCACADCGKNDHQDHHKSNHHPTTVAGDSGCQSKCKTHHAHHNHHHYHQHRSRSRSPHSIHHTHSPHSHTATSTAAALHPPVFQVVEKGGSNPPVYLVRQHSPFHSGKQHEHGGQCSAEEGQHCTSAVASVVDYPPLSYGYQVVEHPHLIGEPLQVISSTPSQQPLTAKKKRWNGQQRVRSEEHMNKYTKVKRVDENKINAQKMLADFAKRSCFAYDPRYDLDLMIVPPPILADDLPKLGGGSGVGVPQTFVKLEMGVEDIGMPHEAIADAEPVIHPGPPETSSGSTNTGESAVQDLPEETRLVVDPMQSEGLHQACEVEALVVQPQVLESQQMANGPNTGLTITTAVVAKTVVPAEELPVTVPGRDVEMEGAQVNKADNISAIPPVIPPVTGVGLTGLVH